MIPFEVEDGQFPPPVPPRRCKPHSLQLRFRRQRNIFWKQVHQFHSDYPARLKVYSLSALFADFLVTNIALNLVQRIHLSEEVLANNWQHVTPFLVLCVLYSFPLIGILKRAHLFLVVYVFLTSIYVVFSFFFTIRTTYRAHYGHFFYRVHYCPTRYVASDSLVCVISLIKFVLLFPVFRFYVHSRDRLEYNLYVKREVRNNYGMVEFQPQQPSSPPKTEPEEEQKEENIVDEVKKQEERVFIEAVINKLYEKSDAKSLQSSSFSSNLDDIPNDYRTYFDDSDFLNFSSSDEEEDILGDIEEEDEDCGVIQNNMQ